MSLGLEVSEMRRIRSQSGRLLGGTVVAACAVAAFAALAAEPSQELEDVQIGETGSILRVALICSRECDVAPGEGLAFRILSVAADLDVDLEARSALARRLTINRGKGASVLTIDAAARVNAARVVSCLSDSGPAPCVEYRFEAPDAAALPAAATPAQPLRNAAPQNEVEANNDEPPFIGALIAPSRPTLRDEPAAGVLYLPQFALPERLEPPAPVRKSDALGDLPANLDVRRPSLLPVDRAQALGDGAAFDFMTEAVAILGKSFDVGACEGAKQRLAADAWALDAMIDHAFCKAADGALDEADADFERLLAYTPDNYEALVGRGLIAIAEGERQRGQDLFQEALNALPPIAESDRIVSAMERN